MLRSNSKSLGNHVVCPEEEKERLQWEGFEEKEGFKYFRYGEPSLWLADTVNRPGIDCSAFSLLFVQTSAA